MSYNRNTSKTLRSIATPTRTSRDWGKRSQETQRHRIPPVSLTLLLMSPRIGRSWKLCLRRGNPDTIYQNVWFKLSCCKNKMLKIPASDWYNQELIVWCIQVHVVHFEKRSFHQYMYSSEIFLTEFVWLFYRNTQLQQRQEAHDKFSGLLKAAQDWLDRMEDKADRLPPVAIEPQAIAQQIEQHQVGTVACRVKSQCTYRINCVTR